MSGIVVRLKEGFRQESGQALVLTGLSMILVICFAGLAIDVGQLRYAQRQLQSAADAAAIAGALEISYCGTSNCAAMQNAAKTAVEENGYTVADLVTQCATSSGSGLSLAVNNGPCAMGSTTKDPNYGNTSYVEAVVTKDKLTYFISLFGFTSVTLSARAEATVGNDPFCLYTSTQNTGSGAANAILMNGNATLTMSCGIMDDSGSSTALLVNGSVTITSTEIAVHGGVLNNGSTKVTPAPLTNVPAMNDPLSWLNSDKPAAGSCSSYSGGSSVSPGTYCSGITINGNKSVTFQPGTYVLGGNMIINGTNSISGTGVTFYFSSGSLIMNGNSHADLVAPTTGTYAGILFFQDSNDSSMMILNGDSTSVFQGTLYLPGANLTINGNGNLAAYTIIDAASFTDNGNAAFHLGNDYSSLPGGSPAKGVAAVLAE